MILKTLTSDMHQDILLHEKKAFAWLIVLREPPQRQTDISKMSLIPISYVKIYLTDKDHILFFTPHFLHIYRSIQATMFIDGNESSPTTATQFWAEKMPQQVRDASESAYSDEDVSELFLAAPCSLGLQRWVSESETSCDSSPAPPMSRIRRWGSAGHLNQMLDEQSTSTLSVPSSVGPLRQVQRWDSELKGSHDECPAPPSGGLLRRRWASDGALSRLVPDDDELSLDDCPPPPSCCGLRRCACRER
jgi:hypothetical protein